MDRHISLVLLCSYTIMNILLTIVYVLRFLANSNSNEYNSMLEKVCTKSIETVGIENIIER